MSYNEQAGRAGTTEYLAYWSARAGAQVPYNYAGESARQNTQARREPPPARSRQSGVRQSQNAAPLRGIREYDTELSRAASRGRRLGLFQNVDTGRWMPFEHLGESQRASDLMRILEKYAGQTYLTRHNDLSYVTAFLRQLDEIRSMIGDSWIGAELCAGHDLSGDWGELLNLFTAFLQGANDLYDRIQVFITRCESAMYDRRGRLRADANQRFMAAFNDGRERANLTGAMRGWVQSVTSLGGTPSSLLREARALQRDYEMEQEMRYG